MKPWWCAAGAAASLLASSCLRDPDCGVCDPQRLVLESITASNYAGDMIHLVSPPCEGPACPEPFHEASYFVLDIVDCERTAAAMASPRGPAEYCRLSPLFADSGLDLVFNNLLDPQSIELVRRRPDNPSLLEVYDWKPEVARLEGPLSRYRGDYRKGDTGQPDRVTRLVNLSCIDNLAAQGRSTTPAALADRDDNPCNAIDEATGLPMRMQASGTFTSYRGRWTLGGSDCATPQDGPDTCCSECDFLLSTRVEKYGVDPSGAPRSPHDGTAIPCTRSDDPFVQCREFLPSVDREGEELRYDYFWSCDPTTPGCERDVDQRVPHYDRVRETFFDDRPAWLVAGAPECTGSSECTDPDGHDLPGTVCVGVDSEGRTCAAGSTEGCSAGRCLAEWFGTCAQSEDVLGGEGYCVDRRFSDRGAGACLRSRAPFDALCDGDDCKRAPQDTAIVYCDHDLDGNLTADECCQDSLGGAPGACDPLAQDLVEAQRWDRAETLPGPTRDCVCTAEPSEECREVVQAACFDDDGALRPERAGQYAVKFVERPGGVIYDPAVKGFSWRPADRGGVPRAAVESCAEQRGLVGARNVRDGWLGNAGLIPESIEDFDRGLCSGSTYTLVFAEPGDGAHVRDKHGNTLQGKARYRFETADFHVRPGSGKPADGLRISACQPLSIAVSNKYDLSPDNLAKIEIWHIDDRGGWLDRVAGGRDCARTRDEQNAGSPPCLVIDVSGHWEGRVGVEVDTVEFATPLVEGERYRVYLPGLARREDMHDPQAYAAAFWDVCGMPLVLGDADDWHYDFTIDPARCAEDPDADGWPDGCDNAPETFNDEQGDMDRDGVGDVVDLCPTVPTSLSNTADSDGDGVGNECDVCRRAAKLYGSSNADVPATMRVRNDPTQLDTDGDGIGDACDNCVRVANCEGFGADDPWRPGDPIADGEESLCQSDTDDDGVGDACQGAWDMALAAGPVGMAPMDDFDQDGVANMRDACPRLPLPDRIVCDSNADCPAARACERSDPDLPGLCDHTDTDGDDAGDVCDTCPGAVNPNQWSDPDGDEDGDFVGRECEPHPSCEIPESPRAFDFYEVAVEGFCCTTAIERGADGELLDARTGNPLVHSAGMPVREHCSEDEQRAGDCVPLPQRVAATPGMLELPAGCEDALGDRSPQDNRRLGAADFGGDVDALWAFRCELPPPDHDIDGVGDACDLCPFAWDDENAQYVDDGGRQWPNAGKWCNGAYSLDALCPDNGLGETTGTGGETDPDADTSASESSTQ